MLWDPWEALGWMEGNEGGFWVKALTAVSWETNREVRLKSDEEGSGKEKIFKGMSVWEYSRAGQ